MTAIGALSEHPEVDNVNRHRLPDGTILCNATMGELVHGILYEIIDDGAGDPIVKVKNIIDGNVYKMAFPSGDFRSH